MSREVERQYGVATPHAAKEALDLAVRSLAVSSEGLRERVGAAGLALGKLSRLDFAAEDLRILDRVRLALMRLDLADHYPDKLTGTGFEPSEEVMEAVAADIVALHELAVDRAIGEMRAGT